MTNDPSLQRFKKDYLLWVALGLLLGILLLAVVAGVGLFTRQSVVTGGQASPIITIVPLPTATQVPPTLMPSATADITPTRIPPPQLEGTFLPGDLVTIFGTAGDGLRLRNQPGLDSTIAFLGVENEVFEVSSGPNEQDGYEWWYLVNPYNPEKSGWAVGNYLRRTDTP
jgi:hypothetical protein